METFSLIPPIEMEQKIYLIALTILDNYNSVFYMTEHNLIRTIFTPRHFESAEDFENLENQLNKEIQFKRIYT